MLFGKTKVLCCSGKLRTEDLAVSTLKGGRAFHASTLGQTSSLAYDEGTHRYVVCSHSLTPKERGDLIITGHELGILRRMAIHPLPNLEKAEELLYKINREIDRILFQPPSESGSTEIREIIGQNFQELNGKFGGDIRSRISSSLKYKKVISDLINEIDVSNVRDKSGLPKYKSLKQKNEGIIDNTIGRAERLLHDYNRILEEAHNARHFVALERMAKSAEETVERNTQIVNLQETAEGVLFFVLVPYYIGHDFSETAHAFIPLIVDISKYENILNVVDLCAWLFAMTISGWFGGWWFAKYYPKSLLGKIAIKLRKVLLRPSMREVFFLIYFLIVVGVLIFIYLSLPGHFSG